MTIELLIALLAFATAIVTTYEPGADALNRWRAERAATTATLDAP